ncbi:MAG: 3-hydroxybutyryl-CoA dehydrogenase [Bdellovibrionota bacterium]|nr:MAG: 3-hydroxybutyryl-CoA dehydrogenase [Bdellovibrionota bacterium]
MATFQTVGVIGAGQMGAGIAQVFASAGSNVLLFDASTPALDRGLAGIHLQLGKLVEKEKISKEQADGVKSRIARSASLKDFARCDLVVEAIIENFEIKVKLFQELGAILPAHTVLASNTSSISITRMAATTKAPGQFIGMHFMNPVPVMKLVEIIRGLQTDDATYQRTKQAAEEMGKTTVLALDGPGFIVNRILCPMINEAIFLLQEGVAPEDIDNAMKLGTNQPMGPLTLADFVGLDTLLYILQLLHRELGEDKYRPCPLLVKYVEAGWFGKKAGRGFYRYEQ